MIIDNVILVGIVLSLILCFCIMLYIGKEFDFGDEYLFLSFLTLILTTLFWVGGYLIFWILKLVFN